MESYQAFINSSSDQQNQQKSTKRLYKAAGIDVFTTTSSKADLYDHLKNHLQVSGSSALILLS